MRFSAYSSKAYVDSARMYQSGFAGYIALDNAMKLSPAEKQTLIGPLVVGCLLGAFCAYAVFAFASEYKLQNGDSIDTWQTAAEAVFAFFVAAVSTAGLLGVLPIAVHRWRAKGGGNV
jgi:Mg/Co/Ni transporter MgtE